MLITLARKPLTGSVASNALQHGCGAINVDACRIGTSDTLSIGSNNRSNGTVNYGMANDKDAQGQHAAGRWPANVLLVPTPDVLAGFPETGSNWRQGKANGKTSIWGSGSAAKATSPDDSGSAARFFKQVG